MKIHLGCGMNYLPGWINLDLDSPLADMHLDLRNPLPYTDNSIQYIFNEHFIEHISRSEGLSFLSECRRILKPHGVLRISTPDLNWLVKQYLEKNLNEWTDVQWVPESPCEMMNQGMREWGHQFVYDLPELNRSLSSVGFKYIEQVPHRDSSFSALQNLECRPWHHELIIEARK